MTIATTLNRIEHTATGGQTIFPYTFLIFADTDLQVFQSGTLLTLTTNYTVSGVGGGGGGNVTLVTGATVNDAIIIVRVMPLTQLTDYVENDKFPADTHEKGLDRAVMIAQQLTEELDRAIKLPITSTLENIDLPVPGAGLHLRWNTAGTALELIAVSTSAVSTPITTLGDLVQGGVAGVPERLAIGSTGQVLEVVAGKAAWATPVDVDSIITTRGDIVQGDTGGDGVRLAIGTLGQFMRPNASGDLAYETLRLPGLVAETELTIASGNITPTGGTHSVDTESDDSTDDLANILTTNMPDGSLLYLRANNTARDVVVKHEATGAGQIHLIGLADVLLRDDLKWILLQRRGADWFEVFTSAKGWQLISRVSPSAVAFLEFTIGIDSTYDLYKVVFTNVLPATDATDLRFRVLQSGVSQSGATDYEWATNQSDSGSAAWGAGQSVGDNDIIMIVTAAMGNATGEGLDGVLYFAKPDVISDKRFWWNITYMTSAAPPTVSWCIGTGTHNGDQLAIDGLRFFMGAGNIASGTFALYGLKK